MGSEELISIIVPIYNAEKYLDDCIRSIARQTYKNIEVLLVDDGSSDGSGDICKQWEQKDKRVRTILQNNGGVSKARNTGVENACGNLLVMTDSDDYISPDFVQVLYDGYKMYDADIVICDYEQGENRGHSFSEGTLKYEQIRFEEIMNRTYGNGHDALRFISPWGKLYKKDLFKNISYPEGRIFEDIYITHQLLHKAETIVTADRKLLYYFRHEDSIMHKPFHPGKLDYLDALKERIAFFKENRFERLEKKAYEEYLHSLVWEYSRVRDILHDDDLKKDIRNRFKEAYVKGYASSKYLQETAAFYKVFSIDPELIMFCWRISALLKKTRRTEG